MELPILNLPFAIIINIFSRLNLVDVPNVALASKDMRKIVSSNEFWREKFIQHFYHRYDPSKKVDNWYAEYQEARNEEYVTFDQSTETLLTFVKDGDLERLKKREKDLLNFIHLQDKNGLDFLAWANKRYIETNDIKFQELLIYLITKILPKSSWVSSATILNESIRYHIPINELNLLANHGLVWETRHRQPYAHLHVAAQHNRADITELLLDRGADIDALAHAGATALLFAVEKNYQNVVSLLLKHKANVLHSLKRYSKEHFEKYGVLPGDMPIHVAAKLGHDQIIRQLLDVETAPRIDVLNKDGATTLLLAVEGGHVEAVQILAAAFLKSKANSNIGLIADSYEWHKKYGVNIGDNALHAAVIRGQSKMTEILLITKLNPNSKGYDGNTPLHYALREGNEEIFSLLLAYDADINVRNNAGWSPLEIALKNNKHKLVRALLRKNASTKLSFFATSAIKISHPKTVELFALMDDIETIALTAHYPERDKSVSELKEFTKQIRMKYTGEVAQTEEFIQILKTNTNTIKKIDELINQNDIAQLFASSVDETLIPMRRATIDFIETRISLAYQQKISYLQLEQELNCFINLDNLSKQVRKIKYEGRNKTYHLRVAKLAKKINEAYWTYVHANGNLTLINKSASELVIFINQQLSPIKSIHENKYGKKVRLFGRSKADDDFVERILKKIDIFNQIIRTLDDATLQFIKLVTKIKNYPKNASFPSQHRILEQLQSKANQANVDYDGYNAEELMCMLGLEFNRLQDIDALIAKFNGCFDLVSNHPKRQSALITLKTYVDKAYNNDISYAELEKQFFVFNSIELISNTFSPIQYKGTYQELTQERQKLDVDINKAYADYIEKPQSSSIHLTKTVNNFFVAVEKADKKKYGKIAFLGRSRPDGQFMTQIKKVRGDLNKIEMETVNSLRMK